MTSPTKTFIESCLQGIASENLSLAKVIRIGISGIEADDLIIVFLLRVRAKRKHQESSNALTLLDNVIRDAREIIRKENETHNTTQVPLFSLLSFELLLHVFSFLTNAEAELARASKFLHKLARDRIAASKRSCVRLNYFQFFLPRNFEVHHQTEQARKDAAMRIVHPENGEVAAAMLSTGHLVSGSQAGALKKWDLTAPLAPRCIASHIASTGNRETSTLMDMLVLPDDRLVTCSFHLEHAIQVWDLSLPLAEQCVANLTEHAEGVLAIALHKNGRLFSGSVNGVIKAWDLGLPVDSACIATITLPDKYSMWKLGVVSENIVVNGSAGGDINVLDVVAEQCVATFSAHNGIIIGFAMLSNGFLVSASNSGEVKVWDVSDPARPRCVDEQQLERRYQTGEATATLMGLTAFAILPGDELVVGWGDGAILISDRYSGSRPEELRTTTLVEGSGISTRRNPVCSLRVAPDGRLISGLADGTITVHGFKRLQVEETALRVRP